jgi:hypothetical protein
MAFSIPTALRAFLRALPIWFRTRYLRPLLLAPIVWTIIVYQASYTDYWGWNDPDACKTLMEIIHPILLAMGILLGFWSWKFQKSVSAAFLGGICLFAFAREIGGQGTSFILYAGLIGLIAYGHSNYNKLTSLLHSRFALSCVATGFICYAASQLFDRGVIKRLGWLFTSDTSWKPPFSSQIEENLETLGGAFLLLAVIAVLVSVMKKSERNMPRSITEVEKDQNAL